MAKRWRVYARLAPLPEMESTLDAIGKRTGRVKTSRRYTAVVAHCFVFAMKLLSVVTAEASERPIATLIKELSNSNAPPVINIRWESHFPETYNWNEQKRVLSVWKELHEKFPEALPLLVENVDKKEYCITVEVGSSGAERNETVGQVCAYIIELNIEPYTRPYAMRTDHGFLRSFDVTVHTPNSRIDLRALRGICKIHRHVVLKRNSAGVGT